MSIVSVGGAPAPGSVVWSVGGVASVGPVGGTLTPSTDSLAWSGIVQYAGENDVSQKYFLDCFLYSDPTSGVATDGNSGSGLFTMSMVNGSPAYTLVGLTEGGGLGNPDAVFNDLSSPEANAFAVPEPGTFALFAAIASIGLLLSRSRHRHPSIYLYLLAAAGLGAALPAEKAEGAYIYGNLNDHVAMAYQFPNAVIMKESFNGITFYGNGVMTGPHTVLTDGHVVAGQLGTANIDAIYPAKGDYTLATPIETGAGYTMTLFGGQFQPIDFQRPDLARLDFNMTLPYQPMSIVSVGGAAAAGSVVWTVGGVASVGPVGGTLTPSTDSLAWSGLVSYAAEQDVSQKYFRDAQLYTNAASGFATDGNSGSSEFEVSTVNGRTTYTLVGLVEGGTAGNQDHFYNDLSTPEANAFAVPEPGSFEMMAIAAAAGLLLARHRPLASTECIDGRGM